MENIPSKTEIKEAFVQADTTGSGKLTFSKMKEVMQGFATEDQKNDPGFDKMNEMVCNMADVNGDKMINFEEILLLIFGGSLEPVNAMKGAFRAYDTNGDGLLDKKELSELMKLSGTEADPKMISMAMAMFDQDNNGMVNYQEFCEMMDGKMEMNTNKMITVKC